jgi:hypothetical protein
MPEPTLRVLLDENVDCLLKPLFDPAFRVVTVQEHEWTGKANSILLRLAAAGFDVFVTMDRNLPYQQNLKALDLAVVVIHARSNAFAHVEPLMPHVNEAVHAARPGAVATVES